MKRTRLCSLRRKPGDRATRGTTFNKAASCRVQDADAPHLSVVAVEAADLVRHLAVAGPAEVLLHLLCRGPVGLCRHEGFVPRNRQLLTWLQGSTLRRGSCVSLHATRWHASHASRMQDTCQPHELRSLPCSQRRVRRERRRHWSSSYRLAYRS